MPAINIMSWNTNGESIAKANFLQNLILNNPAVQGWQPDVILIQEAQGAAVGPVWGMLNGLGGAPGQGNYTNNPAQFVAIGGEGYILKVSNNVALQPGAFAVHHLANDANVQAAVANDFFGAANQAATLATIGMMRNPAIAPLGFAGRGMNLLTWHAPRGPGTLLGNSAAVDYLAYYALQNSAIYTQALTAPGANNVSIVAGDLNIRPRDLANPTGLPLQGIQRIFQNWVGISNVWDHVLAIGNNGGQGINFANDGWYPTGWPGAHAVLVTTVNWP
ncbi:MAG TPA: endonuclease/exonuclease/phosphatase family protein [Longimicrobium sp.]|nr:endonuclease/exonuclease/phosphatase family protein [Longimicrobium sp.]